MAIDNDTAPSAIEREILAAWRRLDAEDKTFIRNLMHGFAADKTKPQLRLIPSKSSALPKRETLRSAKPALHLITP